MNNESKQYINNIYRLLNIIFNVDFKEALEDKSYKYSMDARNLAKKLSKVIEIDPSAALMTGVVRNALKKNLESSKLSYQELADNFALFEEKKDAIIELRQLISEGEIPEKLAVQENYIRETVETYCDKEITEDDVSKLLVEAPEITTEAEKYLNALRPLVFSGSGHEEAPVKFNDQIIATRYVRDIFSLAHQLPQGFSLVGVLGEGKWNAHYVFLAKSGNKCVLFTPNQVNIEPNRGINHVDQRIRSLYIDLLPHNLFDSVEFRSSSEGTKETFTTQIMPIGKIGELDPISIFTVILMFQRVSELWEKHADAPMAFTGDRLLPYKSGSNLPALYQEHVIQLNPESVTNVTREQLVALCDEAGIEMDELTHRNDYLEKAFSPILKDVNLLSEEGFSINYLDKQITVELDAFPKEYLGTKEEMQADVAFVARKNKAKILQALISAYWNHHRKDINLWIKEKMLESGIMNELMINDVTNRPERTEDQKKHCEEQGYGSGFNDHGLSKGYVHRRFVPTGRTGKWDNPIRFHEVFREKGEATAYCPIGESKADLFTSVHLNSAIDIAWITGTDVRELPFHLSVFGFSPYNGNSNLNRIDPVENANLGYSGMKIEAEFAISIKGFNALTAKKGLPKSTKAALQRGNFPKAKSSR